MGFIMARKKAEENAAKSKWLARLFIYAVLVIVGYQIFVLVFGTGAPSFTGLSVGNLPLVGQLDGSRSGKGVVTNLPLTNEGYEKLLEYDRTIQLTSEQKKQYAGFNVYLPCCGFKLTSNEEQNDCRCGHHVATAGLIKFGITKGFSRDKIQYEINQWKPVFYPICNQRPELCDLK